MNGSPRESSAQASSNAQKRNGQDSSGTNRSKRAKYASAACNECKRCKVKCIRFNEAEDCQRCSTMHVTCIVQSSSQGAKDRERETAKDMQEHPNDSHYKQLSEDVGALRQQISVLTATVTALVEKGSNQPSPTSGSNPTSQYFTRAHGRSSSVRSEHPKQPGFIGPTRPAFSFNIAETALTRMGLSTNRNVPADMSSPACSRQPTPDPGEGPVNETFPLDYDCLLSFTEEEIVRLVGIYQEEVVSCHPILDTEALAISSPRILDLIRFPDRPRTGFDNLTKKDVHMLRIVVATALTHEPESKKEICDRLIAAVENDVGGVSRDVEIELTDIRIMAMLSIYFCHIEEELSSWRAIGRAARQALEMGLHRRQSLMDNFREPAARSSALQVFWVVYELDRRWSFGTSLPFALTDRDIDTQLPEPGKEHQYLQCMVSYGRLCSRVWEALPPYGSTSQLIPKENEDYLDFIAQNWLQSLPQELQFRHPRLGLAPKTQPRLLHRLRTLCYLRGNYMRLLIHRHHLLTPDSIKADMQSARLVVDIAKDSIEVLNHLNETSDIYVRQQAIYHFYLLSGLAIMLLAVCHAPDIFAKPCRDTFASAVELVKGFSHNSSASRRLWKSIRGLLPVVRALGVHGDAEGLPGFPSRDERHQSNETPVQSSNSLQQPNFPRTAAGEPIDGMQNLWADSGLYYNGHLGTSTPDIFNLGNDLMNLYDAFGSTGMNQSNQQDAADSSREQGFSAWELGEISRHFQGLL